MCTRSRFSLFVKAVFKRVRPLSRNAGAPLSLKPIPFPSSDGSTRAVFFLRRRPFSRSTMWTSFVWVECRTPLAPPPPPRSTHQRAFFSFSFIIIIFHRSPLNLSTREQMKEGDAECKKKQKRKEKLTKEEKSVASWRWRGCASPAQVGLGAALPLFVSAGNSSGEVGTQMKSWLGGLGASPLSKDLPPPPRRHIGASPSGMHGNIHVEGDIMLLSVEHAQDVLNPAHFQSCFSLFVLFL